MRGIEVKLKNRTAIVTGSAQGIGLAIAKRLAEDGAHVLIADVSDKAQDTAEQIRLEFGVSTDYYVGDLSLQEHSAAMVRKTVDRWGKVDILVNNAGGGVILPFLEHTEETLERTIKRNLWTTLRCCRAILPQMIEQNYGR